MNVAKRFRDMTSAVLSASDGSAVAPAARSWRRWPWLRPVPFALVIAGVLASRRGADVEVAASSPAAALAGVLAARGLECAADDVTWTSGASGVTGAIGGGARALVRASTRGEPNDLYLVEARLSPEGAVLEVGAAFNLTRTASVDESRPVFKAHFAAYTTSVDNVVTGVHVLDLAGRAAPAEFNRTQRAQVAIANLQQTGQTRGIVQNAFGLEPTATRVQLAWRDDGMLVLKADDHDVVLDPEKGEAIVGGNFVRATPEERATPGNVVTWAVDRVRDMPWFGEERMQWVKAIAFTGLDWVRARFAKDATSETVKDELGNLNSGGGAGAPTPTFTDPEIGWPPAPIKAMLAPALPGEGQWIALDKDPFVSQTPGAPAAFLTTFIRPNPKRLDLRVYVTLWDPRQIALHMESGVVEPVSSTGERGPGLIPRTPEVMKRVVAAFNGGFQAQHGEYGMQANRIMYLPPKPYAATVMEMRDGSTAFGTWPPVSSGGGAGGANVPDEVLSYRQNLTALVEFEKFNPWGRNWWGGTPPGWGDNIHTARTALCITKENFVGYFWSASISPDDLAAALLSAGCTYGMHLDMNPGHAGFEFYSIAPESEWKPLGRPMQTDWEAEGKVGQMPGWNFRGRRMIRGMGHMNFPRYIQREGRDFFYLTSRPVLPGAELASATKEPGEGAWRVKGLPQHGFPYALATTVVHPDASKGELKLRVLRVDPRAVKPAGTIAAPSDAATVLSFAGGSAQPKHDEHALWYGGGSFAIGTRGLTKDAVALVVGTPAAAGGATSRAAIGVQDEDGMLAWVELAPEVQPDASTAAAMLALLDKMGCSTKLFVPTPTRALLGGTLDLTAQPATGVTTASARLVRGSAPGAELLFPDTKLEPYSVWQPLQAQRVKVQQRPAASASASGAAPAPPAPSTPASAPPQKAPPKPTGSAPN